MRRLACVTALLFSSGCLSMLPAPYNHGVAHDPSVAQRALDDFGADAPAVVLRSVQRLRYEGGPAGGVRSASTLVDGYRAVRIQSARGLDEANVVVPFGRRDLRSLSVVAYHPDGRRDVLDLGDGLEIERYRPTGRDSRAYLSTIVPVPRATVGTVVELSYTVELDSWVVADELRPSEDLPVLSAELTVIRPRHADIEVEAKGMRREPVETVEDYQVARYTLRRWVPEVAPAFSPADTSPRITLGWRAITVDTMTYGVLLSWDVSAGAYCEDLRNRVALSSAVPVLTAQTGPERVLEAYARVQGQVADRAPLTAGSARPAQEVWDSGFGTAFERAVLLYALLQRAGLEPRFLYIPAQERGPLGGRMPTFITPYEGSMLIAVREGKDGPERLLDTSCLGCRAGELSYAHQRRQGVSFRPNGRRGRITVGGRRTGNEFALVSSRFELTPGEPQRRPRSREVTLQLTPRGLLVKEGRWRYSGALAAALRHRAATMPAAPLEAEAARQFVDGYAEGSMRIEGAEGSTVTLHLRDVLLARSGFIHAPPHVVVPLSTVMPFELSSVLDADDARVGPRERALRLPMPVGFEVALRFELGAADRVESVPSAKAFTRGGGTYRRDVRTVAGAVVVEESLELESEDVAVGASAELRAFLREVEAARAEPLVVTRPSQREAVAWGASTGEAESGSAGPR